MDNTSNEDVNQMINELVIEMKKHFKEESNRRDEFMLTHANLAAEVGEEEKQILFVISVCVNRRTKYTKALNFSWKKEYNLNL